MKKILPVLFVMFFTFLTTSVKSIETPINGLTGYYDLQSHGRSMRQLYYFNSSVIHAVYMTSSDSSNIEDSRRTHYSFSSDGGVTWGYITTVPNNPNLKSGFGFLTASSGVFEGNAIIVNHYGTQLKTFIHTDAFPGLGSFESTQSFSSIAYIFPAVNRFSNNNVLVTGLSFSGRDTIVSQIFNPQTNQWISNSALFASNETNYWNSSFTSATGPNGKALIVVSALYDVNGSFNKNRIFYWTTDNNGVTWSDRKLLYDTQIDVDGDTSRPFTGLDAVYDDNGNFFVVFNTITEKEDYVNSKIWLNKNGVSSKIIARNNEITGAMNSPAGIPMTGVCSMDWPSISISEFNDAVFCAYSVAKQNDVVNGFNSMDIHISYANAGNLQPSISFPITSGQSDERYVSLNRKSFGSTMRKIPAVYQKDPQPGTHVESFDNAPVSRASLIYNEIELILNPLNSLYNNAELPSVHSLNQNFPNPFNPETQIKFEIAKSNFVKLYIYDNAGRLVETIVNQSLSPGTYEVQWNAQNYPSGVYFYRLEVEGFSKTNKMLLIK